MGSLTADGAPTSFSACHSFLALVFRFQESPPLPSGLARAPGGLFFKRDCNGFASSQTGEDRPVSAGFEQGGTAEYGRIRRRSQCVTVFE
jgi:hypothetical protein